MQVHKGILIFLILLVCLLSYFNTLSGNFVWDDGPLINSNPYIRSFKFLPLFFVQNIWNISVQKINSGYYRPLQAASYMWDYMLWHSKPFGYHLTNIIFHMLVCILIFLIFEFFFKEKIIPFFAAIIFAVHPIHTEAVSFISGRVDVLCLFFFLLSILLCLKYVFRKKITFYLSSLLCFLVSLLIKEMAVTLPLIILLIDYLFLSEQRYKKVISNFWSLHLGFFIMLAIYMALRTYFVGWEFLKFKAISASNFVAGTSYFWRLFTVFKIIFYYLSLLLFPYGLKVDYIFSPGNSLFELPVFFGLIEVLYLTFIAMEYRKRYPVLTFSIAWFFVTILPVSNIFPSGNIFADRFMYTPSVGFCVAIAFAFLNLSKIKIKTSLLNWGKSIYIVLLLLIVCFARVTFERNKVWYNNFTLWYETSKASPESKRAHLNLSNEYFNANLLDKATEELNLALKMKTSPYLDYYIINNAGNIYLKKGLVEEAIKAFKIAIGLNPEECMAYLNLSAAYGLKGLYKESIDLARLALKNNPYLDSAHQNLAESYKMTGLIDKAIKEYEEYLNLNPDNFQIHTEVGNLYYGKRDYQKAKLHWLAALKIAKDYKPAKEALKLLNK